MPNGNFICLPYLSALIRLADDIDVAAAMNPILLYDIDALTDEVKLVENKKVKAVRRLLVSESAFTLEVSTPEPNILDGIRQLIDKMQKSLDYCRTVVLGRTPYIITQEKVLLELLSEQAGKP